MCMFYRYVRKTGTPKSVHARNAEDKQKFTASSMSPSESTPEKPNQEPVQPEAPPVTSGGRSNHYVISNDNTGMSQTPNYLASTV